MVVFAYIAIYLMPVLAFLFIVSLLRAIKKIVKDRSYREEVFWSGLLFAIIVWTLAMLALLGAE